jgi:hypothetical protein
LRAAHPCAGRNKYRRSQSNDDFAHCFVSLP